MTRPPPALPVSELPAGSALVRIHGKVHAAQHYDTRDVHRFSAPAGEFGVCYFADSLESAFLETLVRGSSYRVVARADLNARLATTFTLQRSLRLLQLHSEGLVALGLSADVPHSIPYERCQQIALDAWLRDKAIDGIEYRSRWNDRHLCVAVFERAASAVAADAGIRLSDPLLVQPILRRYGIGVI